VLLDADKSISLFLSLIKLLNTADESRIKSKESKEKSATTPYKAIQLKKCGLIMQTLQATPRCLLISQNYSL